jgi:geranylgeranyl diphosphate synthase type II
MAAALPRVETALAAWRDPVRDELLRWIPTGSPVQAILYEPIRAHALRPGKGLRPALCLTACCALGGNAEAALPTASVLELYHNAFLVHDDVEDGSSLRRHEPSLHALYGVPIAVNAGDAMLALALPPLLANTRLLGVGRALRVLDEVAAMARETAEGQAVELDWVRRGDLTPDEDAYVAMVSRKTASYSFVSPLALGAIIAGAAPDRIDALRALGRDIGVAFQIRDDVLSLQPRRAQWGKDDLDDLWEGKRTLILSHAVRRAAPAERERAARCLADARPARRAEDVAFLLELIQRAESLPYADEVARRYARDARAKLDACNEWLRPSAHRDFLSDLIEYVGARDH